ncbi:MAG: hypothetical protein IJS38_00655 [Erysipelotrichaceae bacterium]|nr:hypothetical protein [Erysipelotrichaceae bacterium]
MKKQLSGFQLKLIACLAMTVDHVGAFLYPGATWLRAIGRLAFPIFVYLCNESYLHTSSRHRYVLRMLGWGAAMQVILYYLMGDQMGNALISLALGFLTVWTLEEKQYLFTGLVILSALGLNVQYGLYGIGLMLVFHYLKDDWKLIIPAWAVLNFLFVSFGHSAPVQHLSLISALLLMLYSGREGNKKFQHLFYAYYPLHVAVIYLLKVILYD